VIDFIQTLPGRLVGEDIMELNPQQDTSGITSVLYAKLVKELVSRVLQDRV
jgi:arginase